MWLHALCDTQIELTYLHTVPHCNVLKGIQNNYKRQISTLRLSSPPLTSTLTTPGWMDSADSAFRTVLCTIQHQFCLCTGKNSQKNKYFYFLTVGIATRSQAGSSQNLRHFPAGMQALFLRDARSSLRPNQHPVKWLPGAFSQGYYNQDMKMTIRTHLLPRLKCVEICFTTHN